MHDLILKELQNILLKKEIHQSIQVAYFRHRNLVFNFTGVCQFGHIYVRLHSDSGASTRSLISCTVSEFGPWQYRECGSWCTSPGSAISVVCTVPTPAAMFCIISTCFSDLDEKYLDQTTVAFESFTAYESNLSLVQ